MLLARPLPDGAAGPTEVDICGMDATPEGVGGGVSLPVYRENNIRIAFFSHLVKIKIISPETFSLGLFQSTHFCFCLS